MTTKTISTTIGVCYSLTLLIGGALLSGGGHSLLFMLLAVAPLGAGIFIWPLIASRLPSLTAGRSTYFVMVLLALHYGGIAFYFARPSEGDIRIISHFTDYMFSKELNSYSLTAYVMILVYAIGQFIIWAYIIKAAKKKRTVNGKIQ
jgi:hypothetical protein